MIMTPKMSEQVASGRAQSQEEGFGHRLPVFKKRVTHVFRPTTYHSLPFARPHSKSTLCMADAERSQASQRTNHLHAEQRDLQTSIVLGFFPGLSHFEKHRHGSAGG